MKNLLLATVIWALAATASHAQPQVAESATTRSGQQPTTTIADDLPSVTQPRGKVGLVRGLVKKVDPIHDRLLIEVFGGRDIWIAFDPRTEFRRENTRAGLTAIPSGSVVSVDTVIDGGKLFALSVRADRAEAAELNGQIDRYDAGKSQLIVRDPVSPESVSLHITPATTVVNHGQTTSPQALSAGMLVRVSFSPKRNTANSIEILAERGGSFAFQGRIVAVDLRSRVLTLSDDSDQSIRELAIGSLDANSLDRLREGVDVSIQAEFDGTRYNIRTIALRAENP